MTTKIADVYKATFRITVYADHPLVDYEIEDLHDLHYILYEMDGGDMVGDIKVTSSEPIPIPTSQAKRELKAIGSDITFFERIVPEYIYILGETGMYRHILLPEYEGQEGDRETPCGHYLSEAQAAYARGTTQELNWYLEHELPESEITNCWCVE